MVSSPPLDSVRQQRCRELDAWRRESCVCLGSCQESWGQLKNHLGFSLLSELAHCILLR
uniref:Uncharacterized protein n=1 Tax=Esox lucius TaxID=8010 RepID=A0A3P8YER8_ESOLU